MQIDMRMREAITAELKAEANELGLVGDAFWLHVWRGVEQALVDAGDLPRAEAQMPRATTRSA